MKCKHCSKTTPHTHAEKDIKDKGFPTSSKNYASAHEEASKAEKKKYSSASYNVLKKMDREAGKTHTLIGKNTKSGRIEVSDKVPKALRGEVAFHERTENKLLKKGKKK